MSRMLSSSADSVKSWLRFGEASSDVAGSRRFSCRRRDGSGGEYRAELLDNKLIPYLAVDVSICICPNYGTLRANVQIVVHGTIHPRCEGATIHKLLASKLLGPRDGLFVDVLDKENFEALLDLQER